MTNFIYSLDNYSWESALLWGNFRSHCEKASDSQATFGHRFVHILIAAAEFLPIIGQIASIFEKIIVENFSSAEPKIDPNTQGPKNNLNSNEVTSIPTTSTVDKNISVLNIKVKNPSESKNSQTGYEKNEEPLLSTASNPSFPQNSILNSMDIKIKEGEDEVFLNSVTSPSTTSTLIFPQNSLPDPVKTKIEKSEPNILNKHDKLEHENQTITRVTKIQSFFRVFLAAQKKEHIETTTRAATKIQSIYRMALAAQEKEHIETTIRAATKIQSIYRMALAAQKKEEIETTIAATKIQSIYRMALAAQKKEEIETTIAATKIQSFCRMHQAQLAVEDLKFPFLLETEIEPPSPLNKSLKKDLFDKSLLSMKLIEFIRKSDEYYKKTEGIPKETIDLINERIENYDQKIQLKKRLKGIDEFSAHSILVRDIFPSWSEADYLKSLLLTHGEICQIKISDIEKIEKSKLILETIGTKTKKYLKNEHSISSMDPQILTFDAIKKLKLTDFSRLSVECIKEHIKNIPSNAFCAISIWKIPKIGIENLSSEQFEVLLDSEEWSELGKGRSQLLLELLTTNNINNKLLNVLLPDSLSFETLKDLKESEIYKLYPFFSCHHWKYLRKSQAIPVLDTLIKEGVDAKLIHHLMYIKNSYIYL